MRKCVVLPIVAILAVAAAGAFTPADAKPAGGKKGIPSDKNAGCPNFQLSHGTIDGQLDWTAQRSHRGSGA